MRNIAWIIFFAAAWLIVFICIPLKEWKHLWLSAIIGIFSIYIIDTTFISLGAFSYTATSFMISNIPGLYLLSGGAGGAILAFYYPDNTKYQLPYILLIAFLFLLLELLMYWIGYFHYNHWNPVQSYFLNIFGFIFVLFLYTRLRLASANHHMK